MILQVGQVAWFRLSAEGKTALPPVMTGDLVQALVTGVDELGVWIIPSRKGKSYPDATMFLLKWDYFATAILETKPEMPSQEIMRKIGFRP